MYLREMAFGLLRKDWFLAVAAALIVYLAIGIGSGAGAASAVLPVALTFAALFVIVGIGQMFVISFGPGNIDLSIPMVMTLSAYLATGQMHAGTNEGIISGVLLGLVAGAAFGFGNGLLVHMFKIPPMITTLATGLIAQSAAFVVAGQGITKPGIMLVEFSSSRIAGVPIIAIFVFLFSLFVSYMIRRSILARSIFACGQSKRAAYLAGVKVQKVLVINYTICGFMAGLGGILVAGFQGGASLSMASEYLVISIAVVVLGGTPITGGRANVTGLWGAAVFLFLTTSLLNSHQVSYGMRNVLTGALILLVLVISSRIQKRLKVAASQKTIITESETE